MTLESARVSAVLPASADAIYAAWLDSRAHSRMTGGRAEVDGRVGGEFSAWNDYIHGSTLALEPGRRIVQTWRTTDFPLGHADSRVEVHLLEVEGGTETMIIHTEIPEGQGAKYGQGWQDHYLVPMRKYFTKPARKTAARKAKAAAPKTSRKGASNKAVAARKPAVRRKAAKTRKAARPAAKARKK